MLLLLLPLLAGEGEEDFGLEPEGEAEDEDGFPLLPGPGDFEDSLPPEEDMSLDRGAVAPPTPLLEGDLEGDLERWCWW